MHELKPQTHHMLCSDVLLMNLQMMVLVPSAVSSCTGATGTSAMPSPASSLPGNTLATLLLCRC